MALVHDGAAHAVNGSGRAPRAAPAGKYPEPRSVDTITVPGTVSAWQTMAERWGIRPLAAALKEAAELARGGVPIARSLARALEDAQQVVTADAGLQAVRARRPAAGRGRHARPGAAGRNAGAARQRWSRGLLPGGTGRTLVAGLAELGCALTMDDLALHRTDIEPALHRSVLGRDLLTMGANSQGFCLIQIMAGVAHMRSRRSARRRRRRCSRRVFRESIADRDALPRRPGGDDRGQSSRPGRR